MKKLLITLTHELEVPDHFELVMGPDGTLLKTGEKYLNPHIEYLQSVEFSPKQMTFLDLDESARDTIFGSISRATKVIREINPQ
jgi:hypothetical protein